MKENILNMLFGNCMNFRDCIALNEVRGYKVIKSMEQSPWETNCQSPSQEITLLFGIQGSLPFSQEPTNGPHPEPDASSPCLPAFFP